VGKYKMVKNMARYRTLKTSIILGILLVSAFAFIPGTTVSQQAEESSRLISFNSYIDLDYDTSPLNDPLAIDVSVTVPVKVRYWTDIPAVFRSIPFPINFMILFGQAIGPMQKIHLEILNPPDWANVYISSPDVLTDIPFSDEEPKEITANLILSPRVEAPAVSYKIDLVASCGQIKRLNGFSYQESIDFTPSFIPTIQITPHDPIRTVAPHETINFKIDIKNLGNKITRVTPTLKGANEDWTPTINPPEYEIPPNQQNTFTFSIVTPFDFGWHNDYGRFQIDFEAEVYPYRTGAANLTQSIYLVVNNYGFSTPGFEFITVIMAMIVIGIIIKRRRLK
jgi:hypothetical protein